MRCFRLPTYCRRARAAMSLLEVCVVLVILAMLASLVIPLIGRGTDDARFQVTRRSLITIRQSIVGGGSASPSYRDDVGKLPATMADLFRISPMDASIQPYSRVTGIGWRGPYLQHLGAIYGATAEQRANFPESVGTQAYGAWGVDPAMLDAWGNPYVLQTPLRPNETESRYARIVSAGENGILETPASVAELAPGSCGDVMGLYLFVADTAPWRLASENSE